MPETNLLLASKVIATESPPSTQTIQALPTAVPAFVGLAKRGPIAEPTFITSFKQFVATFGSYSAVSNLALAVEGYYQNVGAGGIWVTRTCHFSDVTNPATAAAVAAAMTLLDRGGTAAKAKLQSVTGPFSLLAGQTLVINYDGNGGDNTLTFTASPASVTIQAGTYNLTNGWKLVYQVRLPGSTSLGPLREIKINTADYSNIAAATAEELQDAINKQGIGIKCDNAGGGTLTVKTDKQGSDARLVIDSSSTAGLLTALNLTAGTNNGSGNVADIEAVDATEIAALLTALTLVPSGATATASGGKVILQGVTVGPGGSVTIRNTSTALGIFSGNLPVVANGTNSAQQNTLIVTGKDPGNWISEYRVVVTDATSGDSDRFNLAIIEIATGEGEIHANLSLDPDDARYVEDYVNANSSLVTITDLADSATSPSNLPANGTFTVWAGGNDGLSGLADIDFIGSSAGKTGIYAFDSIDNITLLVSPDRATASMHNAMWAYCEVTRRKRVFTLLDSPSGLNGPGIVNYKNNTAALAESSDCAELHWPRIKITNPNKAVFGPADTITVPPSGHLAGVFARADASKPGGVYEAPAGLLNNYGTIVGAVGLETDTVNDEAVRDLVTPERINPICRINGSVIHLDGHDTLKSTSPFPSIPERRGASFIEASCVNGTTFVKHRKNTRDLRMTVKRTIDSFLLTQYAVGAFRGDTPAESFKTDVSDQLNPEELQFAGQMRVNIGLATAKPIKWLILDFSQDTRKLDERLAQVTGA